MTELDKLDAMITDAEIKAAMARARKMRSEEAAKMFKSVVRFFTPAKRQPVVTETGVTCAI